MKRVKMPNLIMKVRTAMHNRLFDITQSIIAILLTVLIIYLVINKLNVPDAVYAILSAVVGYYFGRQVGPNNRNVNGGR